MDYVRDGIYWRNWWVKDQASGEQRDCSSWVWVKLVGNTSIVYRKIIMRNGKYWMGDLKVSRRDRFMPQLERMATKAELDMLWDSIRAPIPQNIESFRKIQNLVSEAVAG